MSGIGKERLQAMESHADFRKANSQSARDVLTLIREIRVLQREVGRRGLHPDDDEVSPLARSIVKAILRDLGDRHTIRQALESVDREATQEMEFELIAVVKAKLKKRR